MNVIDTLKFDEKGLIPCIVQDYKTKEILMFAFMNRESLEITFKENKACFWSRSRKKLWRKGEESGNVQNIKKIWTDCDSDVVLIEVEQVGGAACHTGYRSCFFKELAVDSIKENGTKVFDPQKVYKKK